MTVLETASFLYVIDQRDARPVSNCAWTLYTVDVTSYLVYEGFYKVKRSCKSAFYDDVIM